MTNDNHEAELFREEPVDVSRKYGVGLVIAGVAVTLLNHFYDPVVAAYVASAVIFSAGIGFYLPHGNRVIQWRTSSNE